MKISKRFTKETLLYRNGWFYFDGEELTPAGFDEIPENFTVKGDLVITDLEITSLPKGLKVRGNLTLTGSGIATVPSDTVVDGRLNVGKIEKLKVLQQQPGGELVVFPDTDRFFYTEESFIMPDVNETLLIQPGVTRLPENLVIYMHLNVEHSNLIQLPDNLSVFGCLYVNLSSISHIPKGVYCEEHNISTEFYARESHQKTADAKESIKLKNKNKNTDIGL